MPRGKWIDKKTAQHFTLVHRPQNDPLIHDEAAPSMVLNPTENANAARKSKALNDLASELGSDADFIRANEGEAATYGVYFDDTEYDYMQHLRDLGSGSGGAVFVEAKDEKSKGKQKESLADALERLEVGPGEQKKKELFDDEILPSKNLTRRTYQDMQDVPDIIGGLQPDMDPRLREVLEALEDEEYVDEDEDIFTSLTKDGKELEDHEFEEEEWFDDEEDDAGWETDGTAKPDNEYKTSGADDVPDLVPVLSAEEAAEAQDQVGDWMADFTKFKKDQKKSGASDLQSSILSTTTNGGRKKKRKGALTNPSAYSMTSSSLVRTEQMGILDARFDNLEQKVYNKDDDYDGYAGSTLDDDTNSMISGVSGMTGMTGASNMSTVTGPIRKDFDSVLDEFLGGHSTFNKKYLRKGGYKSGTDQLDEIRKELGPARIKGKTAAAATGAGSGSRSTAKARSNFLS
ncbi:low-temperature viability protein ltv1 [Apiospora kogelbergensis]|uniref:Low-temperature viability protein ltv1 n=1 Tax=Apiospora kogelbergensis TaxID=1337665 RepID=A0AAW0QET9_9PEZI